MVIECVVCLGCGTSAGWDLTAAAVTTPEGYRQEHIIHGGRYGCGTRMRRFFASDGTPRPWEVNRSPKPA